MAGGGRRGEQMRPRVCLAELCSRADGHGPITGVGVQREHANRERLGRRCPRSGRHTLDCRHARRRSGLEPCFSSCQGGREDRTDHSRAEEAAASFGCLSEQTGSLHEMQATLRVCCRGHVDGDTRASQPARRTAAGGTASSSRGRPLLPAVFARRSCVYTGQAVVWLLALHTLILCSSGAAIGPTHASGREARRMEPGLAPAEAVAGGEAPGGQIWSEKRKLQVTVGCGMVDASGHAEIPDSVTSIGERAFKECSSLTSIVIPDSVTSLGSSAFEHCSSLTSVAIPESVTSIGDGAFKGCSSLNSVIVPDSLTSIGSYAFFGCGSLTNITIPNVTTIGSDTFNGCSSLASVAIPDTVVSIGNAAFKGCSELTSVMIPDSVTTIGNHVFESCASLTTVAIPNSVSSFDTYGAFLWCPSLVSVTLPDTLGVLAYNVFHGCSSLASLRIPQTVTAIGLTAFLECTSLTDISIPNSVTTIGDRAFEGCTSLAFVSIPDSVTSIGSNAFKGCSSLASVSIPDSVTSIRSGTFNDCSSLALVVVGDAVTSIGNSAFAGCTSLTFLLLGSSVESFEFHTFLATPLQYAPYQTSIALPATVNYWNVWRIASDRCGGGSSLNLPACPTLDLVSIAGNDPASCRARAGDSITLTFAASERLVAPWCMFGVTPSALFATDTSAGAAGTSWSCSYTVTADDEPADSVPFTISGPVHAVSATTDGSSLSSKTCIAFSATYPTPYTPGYSVTNPAATMQCMLGLSCTAGFAGLPTAPCTIENGTFEPLSGCEPCGAGQYADVSALAHCRDCPVGKYSSTAGSTSAMDCISCEVGRYVDTAGSTNCIDCTAGKYTGTVGQSHCTDCPVGTYASLSGSPACDQCSQGRYSTATAAIDASTCACCPAGKASLPRSAVESNCTDCSAGKWRGDSACLADNSPRPCIDCAADTYGVVLGATSEAAACIECPSFASTVGRTGVSGLMGCWCIEGYQMSYGTCRPCPLDTYSPETSTDACLSCPPHSTTNGVTGASTVSQCVCLAGYTGTLTACGRGCVVGTCDPCPAKFYKQSPGLSECVRCPANAISAQASTAVRDCACDTASGYTSITPIISWCDRCVPCLANGSCTVAALPSVEIAFADSRFASNSQKVSPTARVLLQSFRTGTSTLQWSGSRLLSDCNSEALESQLNFGPGGVLASSSVSWNIVFGEGALIPGGMYRVRLEATTGEVHSTAELLFTVNTLPANGTVRVSPSFGTAGQTFVIIADDWVDEDMPLMYRFAVLLDSDQPMPLNEQSTCNLTSAMLPQGNADRGFEYEVLGSVSDVYDATAESRSNVTVLAAAPPSSWEDSVKRTIESVAVQGGTCGGGIDPLQAIGAICQNLNQQPNAADEAVRDASRARELVAEFMLDSVTADVNTSTIRFGGGGSSVDRIGSVIADLTSVPEQVTDRLVSDALTVLQTISAEDVAPTLSQSATTSIATSASNIILTEPSVSHTIMLQNVLVQASAGVAAGMVPGEDAAVVRTPAFELAVQRFGNDSESVAMDGGHATLPLQLLASENNLDVQLVRWETNPFLQASAIPLAGVGAPNTNGFSIAGKPITLNIIGPDRQVVRVDGVEGIFVRLPVETMPLNVRGNCSACANTYDILHGEGACDQMLAEGMEQRQLYPLADRGYSCATHFCADCIHAGFCNRSCNSACVNTSNSTSSRDGSTCVLPAAWQCNFFDWDLQRWRVDGKVLQVSSNYTECEFTHLTDFAAAVGPPIQTQPLSSLRDTFDIAEFARFNPVGFVASVILLVLVMAVSWVSIRAHARNHKEQRRLYIKRRAIVKEYAVRMVGVKGPSLAQHVLKSLRTSWTLGALCIPLDGDPFSRLQRMLVLVCTTMCTLAVNVLFFKPTADTRQLCEGEPQGNGYPTQCTEGWIDSSSSCTCKVFDCNTCNCNQCDTIARCRHEGCSQIVPNGSLAFLVTVAITVPISLIVNFLFKWFHKTHMQILEIEAPNIARTMQKTGQKLRANLQQARERIETHEASNRTVAVSEIDSMLQVDAGREFKALEAHQTLRSAVQEEKGTAALELVDLPPCKEGEVYFTNASGMHVPMPREDREQKLAELEAAGRPRVGQLDDPASRPVRYAVVPFGVTIAVGIGSVLVIASGVRQLTVARTLEWLGGTAGSLLIKWLVLDPLKILLLTPITMWALKRKLRREMQLNSQPKVSLADALLNTASLLQGTSAGDSKRMRQCIRTVVSVNRAAKQLQREALLRATRQEKERLAADAKQRLAAAIESALEEVEGSTEHITNMKQALHAKHAQKKEALFQANVELDREISKVLDDRVDGWNIDWRQQKLEVMPAQLYHRAMTEYEAERSALLKKAQASRARLEEALGWRAAKQKQEQELADQEKQMEQRLLRAQQCMQRYQTKIKAITTLGKFDITSTEFGGWMQGPARNQARQTQTNDQEPLSIRQRMARMVRAVSRQSTTVKQFTATMEPETESELEPQVDDVATIALRERLSQLRPVALHKRCVAEGIDADELELALQMGDSKTALIELLVGVSVENEQVRRAVAP